jgi:serine phosphatase RsbU (regulator of sigma subunit)
MQAKRETADDGDRERRVSQGKAHPKRKRVFGLQARTVLLYLLVAVLYALALELLVASGWYVFLTHSPASLKAFQKTGQIPTYLGIVQSVLFTSIIWIILVAPPSLIFGVLVTRRLVRRVKRLVDATNSFAQGDYSQRVDVRRSDEVGLLEERFNQMAQQLVESMRKEQELIEYNTRMEERARMEQEMQTARLIQHSLLPKEVPSLPGWRLATYYQPAREVGGDLYDFLTFADGRLGLVIGDVTDKGVPAALVMATTCTMLRTATGPMASPCEVLARVNDLLCVRIPSGMFVTCLYALLDPGSGLLRYANAGQNLPYYRSSAGVSELWATGMPLGMMPGTRYEEREVILAPGDDILFYSDGLVEAHNPEREMFSFPRLKKLLEEHSDEASLIDFLLSNLKSFTREGWQQEDDVTLLTLQRTPVALAMNEQQQSADVLLETTLVSVPDNE